MGAWSKAPRVGWIWGSTKKDHHIGSPLEILDSLNIYPFRWSFKSLSCTKVTTSNPLRVWASKPPKLGRNHPRDSTVSSIISKNYPKFVKNATRIKSLDLQNCPWCFKKQVLSKVGWIFKNKILVSSCHYFWFRLTSWGKGSLPHYGQGFLHPGWLFGMSSINSSSPILLWTLMYLNPIENMFLCHPTIILCTFFSHSLRKNVCNSKGASYLTRSILSKKKFTKPQTSKKKRVWWRQTFKDFHQFWARISPQYHQYPKPTPFPLDIHQRLWPPHRPWRRSSPNGANAAHSSAARRHLFRTVGTVNESTNDPVDRKFPTKILKRYHTPLKN